MDVAILPFCIDKEIVQNVATRRTEKQSKDAQEGNVSAIRADGASVQTASDRRPMGIERLQNKSCALCKKALPHSIIFPKNGRLGGTKCYQTKQKSEALLCWDQRRPPPSLPLFDAWSPCPSGPVAGARAAPLRLGGRSLRHAPVAGATRPLCRSSRCAAPPRCLEPRHASPPRRRIPRRVTPHHR
jgi:hypothetical protein